MLTIGARLRAAPRMHGGLIFSTHLMETFRKQIVSESAVLELLRIREVESNRCILRGTDRLSTNSGDNDVGFPGFSMNAF